MFALLSCDWWSDEGAGRWKQVSEAHTSSVQVSARGSENYLLFLFNQSQCDDDRSVLLLLLGSCKIGGACSEINSSSQASTHLNEIIGTMTTFA
jgi:hypothetical protein